MKNIERVQYNTQLIKANLIYLLGTADAVSTGSLNTSDCAAVLLGEHRYDRGQKIFQFYQENYSSSYNHQLLEVVGVGHNSTPMYNSQIFKAYLNTIF